MISPSVFSDLELLVDIGVPMEDIIATLPYALPALFIATVLLLYQRHLPQDDLKRNMMVLFSILCILGAGGLVVYAASGALWWEFGSYGTFSAGLQIITDIIFGSTVSSLVYIVSVGILIVVFSYFMITPPEPDIAGLREDLKLTKEVAQLSKQAIFKLEGENKKLNEFIAEKEETLSSLEGELEAIRAEVSTREASIKLMEDKLAGKIPASTLEDELKAQIQERDQSIESLQIEIADLRLVLENTESTPTVIAPAPSTPIAPIVDDTRVRELEAQLQTIQAKWEDLWRRSETAEQVSDSVISDLVELISQVESSKRDDSAKATIVQLIEGLGRSMTRVAREAGEPQFNEPKIEMIGAILMVNEIIDAIKKMVRKS
jgi:predicted RNase H-like nuclease (RuvC/YqgF family)